MARALIVSAGTSSNEYLAQHAAECGYPRPTIVPSAGEARRLLNSGDYDLVIINAPLPDELGHELALYVTQNTMAGSLLLVKQALADQVNERLKDSGALILSKPFNAAGFHQAVRLTAATARRLAKLWQENRALRAKIETIRIIDRAKCLLVETKGIKERDAHRYIEKEAMDSRRTRLEVAEEILAELAEEDTDE